MRKKISISLSRDLLKRIDQSPVSRSVLVEKACRAYLARLDEIKDLRTIQAHADRLNREATDVIGYQHLP